MDKIREMDNLFGRDNTSHSLRDWLFSWNRIFAGRGFNNFGVSHNYLETSKEQSFFPYIQINLLLSSVNFLEPHCLQRGAPVSLSCW